MNLKTWEINGVELELDLEDADVLERYENAFEEMAQAEKEIPESGKQSARIRAYCGLFRKLYDRIFGDGTSDKIFSNVPTSSAAYDEIYCQFLDFAEKQIEESARQRSERLAKYKPVK